MLVRGERFTEFTEPPFDREALIAASEGMAWHARPSQPREPHERIWPDATGTTVADRGRAAVEAVLQGRSRSAAAISLLREAALLPVLVILLIVGAFLNSAFLTVSNFSGIGQQISALGVIVVGESLDPAHRRHGPVAGGHLRAGARWSPRG